MKGEGEERGNTREREGAAREETMKGTETDREGTQEWGVKKGYDRER